MNKTALESAVATKLGVSKAEAGRLVETVMDCIVEGAVANGECVMPGLGKLEVKSTPARSGEIAGKKWSTPAGKAFKLNVLKEGKAKLV